MRVSVSKSDKLFVLKKTTTTISLRLKNQTHS